MQAQTTSMGLIGIWPHFHSADTERNVHSFRSALKPLGKKPELRHFTSPPRRSLYLRLPEKLLLYVGDLGARAPYNLRPIQVQVISFSRTNPEPLKS